LSNVGTSLPCRGIHTHGLLGKESRTLLKKVSTLLAEKWEKPYSEICGYANAQMGMAMVRATHLCLRGLPYPNEDSNEQLPASVGGQGWPRAFPEVKYL
jgi:hypothetical protein